MKGWHIRQNYPSDFNKPFLHFVDSRLIKHYVRTLNDLFMLRVPELASNLAVRLIAEGNTFLGSRFEFSAVIVEENYVLYWRTTILFKLHMKYVDT